MSDAAIRAHAARTIAQVQQGRSLDDAFVKVGDGQQALYKQLCYGTLRHWRRLLAQSERLLDKKIKANEHEVRALLCLGIYQIDELRIANHAAVNATVAATKPLKRNWARGLINACLRKHLKQESPLEYDSLAVEHSHPDWLFNAIQASWGESTPDILTANQTPGPMTLRVNAQQYSSEEYLAKLEQGARRHGQGLTLEAPCNVQLLPDFAKGAVSVQDLSAQQAAHLLAPKNGERILDACSAPGGKTLHILETAPEAQVTALDWDEDRLIRVEENLERLQFTADCRAADAAVLDAWWDEEPYDAILLDAPCSGTGVIRRHPDIKWLRREDDIPALAEQQAELLDALWKTLKPGGRLLYATCSILDAENRDIVQAFLERTADASEQNIELAQGEAAQPGWRIPPGGDWDGFFYCLLHKSDVS